MKKNVLMVVGIIVFAILMIGIAYYPNFLKEYETKSNSIIKNNCKVYTKELLNAPSAELEIAAKETALHFNKTYKNPVNRKEKAFVWENKCAGCVNIEFNQNTQSVNVTGYDKDLKILCRIIIKPPSYVTYEKEK